MGNVNLEHANSDVTQIKWECGMLLLEEQDWSFLELPCTILPKSQPPEGPLRSSHVQNAKARFISALFSQAGVSSPTRRSAVGR